jgi:hypothetical protein
MLVEGARPGRYNRSLDSRKRGRVVDCNGLENRRPARAREFESHRFRHSDGVTRHLSIRSVDVPEIRLKTCLIALALSLPPLLAAAAAPASTEAARPAASGPAAAASAACPGRSAPSLADRRATSKARHTVDDGDPCADPHSPPVRH